MRQHRGAARRGHRRPDRRGVRGRGVVVPARPHPPLRPRRGDLAELRPRPPRRPRRDLAALRGGQGPHLGRPRARRRWPSPTPTTPSCCADAAAVEPAVTFGLDGSAPTATVDGGRARRLDGAPARRRRRAARAALPHDLANALAAAATAVRGRRHARRPCAAALRAFHGLPHRVELVAEAGGVRWYDDSKATAPHATRAARARLRLGRADRRRPQQGPRPGRRWPSRPHHIRAVVAIGEAADEVVAAVRRARPGRAGRRRRWTTRSPPPRALAQPGDVVLLSPGVRLVRLVRVLRRAGRRLRRRGPRPSSTAEAAEP